MAKVIGPLFVALLWAVSGPMALAQTNFHIIPEPQHLTRENGVFVFHLGERIQAPADHRAQWIADFLRDHVAKETGVSLKVVKAPSHGSIVLRIDSSIKNKAAYHLTVTPAKVVIAAKDNRGLFWGVQTLRQLLPLHHEQHAAIPAVRIKDAPRYSWRGVMLDVGRHFYPVSFVKKQIALMSYYKFDVFHWHLTEDQGWRIQIKRYPKLTSVGAWRTEPDGKRYGGFYTQQQIRDVVAYARKRNVMVVPEIEMPGHSSAAIAAYPDLSCNDKPIAVPNGWGVFRNADCPIKASTYKFLENVLDEVMQLFPSPYVHIGGDEVPAGEWSKCASCQQFAKEHGLVAGEKGLHGYFVRHIGKYLRSKGKTLVGWDEITEGHDTNPNDVVEVWHLPSGIYGGSSAVMRKALANGNRVIIAGPFYINFPIDVMTLKDLYRAHPFTNPLFKKYPGKVLGGEVTLWSEHATPLNGVARLYPRLLAISEHFWGSTDHNWSGFQRRVHAQETWLASQHVAYGPENQDIVDYRVRYNSRYRRWRIRAARGFNNLLLHYTLDGKQPTSSSPSFKNVLDLYHPAKVTVAPFRGKMQYQKSATFDFVPSLALGDSVTSTATPSRGSPAQLTDGILGATDLGRNGLRGAFRWVVWPSSGMNVTIDLGRVETIHSIKADFLQAGGARAVVPPSVTFQTSTNGKDWSTVDKVRLNVSYAKRGVVAVHPVEHQMQHATQVRYIRVIATSPKYGHVFSDEIAVR